MKLEEQIKEDLKGALKTGDGATRDVLRFLTSDIKNEAIRIRKDLEEKDVLAVVRKNIKSRKDSVEQFMAGGRADLAEKEKSEIAILEKYMPTMMNEQEIEKVVRDVIGRMDASQAKNFGMVMKEAVKELDGKADGGMVSQIVKKTLIG